MGIIDKMAGTLARRQQRQEMPTVGGEVLALRDNLDRWLERFFDEPWGFPAVGGYRGTPPVHVNENDDAVIVSADVPGLGQEDLELEITEDSLTIRGETHRTGGRPGGASAIEQEYQRFTEVVPLPFGLAIESAEAHANRGALPVTTPKATPGPSGRHIPTRA